MTKIKPLAGLRYNQQKGGELRDLVCPPYDVISAAQQEYYHTLNPHNFIRIILAKDEPGVDKYEHSAELFNLWLKEGVFAQDKTEAIYFYRQEFSLHKVRKVRVGFISLLRLGEKGSEVFGHEFTKAKAKEDRFKLLKKVKANLSPIFVIFQDKKRIVKRFYQRILKEIPLIQIDDHEGVRHTLWRIDRPEDVKAIQEALSFEDVFIADGHHRYEVACAYRDLKSAKSGARLTGEESFNYLLSYFTNTDPQNLVILPIHRLLKLEREPDWKQFYLSLGEFFEMEEVKDRARFFFLLEKAGRSEHAIGVYANKSFVLLRLKNVKTLDLLLAGNPKELRGLDVAILNALILERLLKINPQDCEGLTFSPHVDQIIAEVDSGKSNLGFFLNPVKVGQIIAVAGAGLKMPPKSTYFYPKVLSGLVINKLD